MVDSLLSSSHVLESDDEQDADRVERRQIADFPVIRGYKVKPKRLEALGELKEICAPVSMLDNHLSTLADGGGRAASRSDGSHLHRCSRT